MSLLPSGPVIANARRPTSPGYVAVTGPTNAPASARAAPIVEAARSLRSIDPRPSCCPEPRTDPLRTVALRVAVWRRTSVMSGRLERVHEAATKNSTKRRTMRRTPGVTPGSGGGPVAASRGVEGVRRPWMAPPPPRYPIRMTAGAHPTRPRAEFRLLGHLEVGERRRRPGVRRPEAARPARVPAAPRGRGGHDRAPGRRHLGRRAAAHRDGHRLRLRPQAPVGARGDLRDPEHAIVRATSSTSRAARSTSRSSSASAGSGGRPSAPATRRMPAGCSARRSPCGAARPSTASTATGSSTPSSRASSRCASRRRWAGSTPTSASAARPRSWTSWRLSPASIRWTRASAAS